MAQESKRALDGGNEDSTDVDTQMERCRQRIDELDAKLIQLLNMRASCALRLGRLKESVGLDTYQPDREIAVLEQVRKENRGPLDAGAVTRLFERIIDESRRLERIAEEKGKPK